MNRVPVLICLNFALVGGPWKTASNPQGPLPKAFGQ